MLTQLLTTQNHQSLDRYQHLSSSLLIFILSPLHFTFAHHFSLFYYLFFHSFACTSTAKSEEHTPTEMSVMLAAFLKAPLFHQQTLLSFFALRTSNHCLPSSLPVACDAVSFFHFLFLHFYFFCICFLSLAWHFCLIFTTHTHNSHNCPM